MRIVLADEPRLRVPRSGRTFARNALNMTAHAHVLRAERDELIFRPHGNAKIRTVASARARAGHGLRAVLTRARTATSSATRAAPGECSVWLHVLVVLSP